MTTRSLPENEVHLWHIALCGDEPLVGCLRKLLAADEIERADRFVFDQHRQRFTIGRATMRQILASYLGQSASDIHFHYNPRGKPLLRTGELDLRFNLTHSAEVALLAVTRSRDVGIDLEEIRQLEDADRMASHYFSRREYEAFRQFPPATRLEGFFNYWTLKEAYIKARGEGLAIPLDQFSMIPIDPQSTSYRVETEPPSQSDRWSAVRLPMPSGFVASLVVEGDQWQLVRHQSRYVSE